MCIRDSIQGLNERSELDITLEIPEDFGRLSSEMELVIFRIVQECLTNVHRHSGSKLARIGLSRIGQIVSIEVQDEGKGIAPEKLLEIQSQGAGVGICGMRERVTHLSLIHICGLPTQKRQSCLVCKRYRQAPTGM